MDIMNIWKIRARVVLTRISNSFLFPFGYFIGENSKCLEFSNPFSEKEKKKQLEKEKKLIVICPQAFLNLIFKKKCGNRENVKNPLLL